MQIAESTSTGQSFVQGNVTVNVTQNGGLPYSGPFRVIVENVQTGSISLEPPGPPFTGSGTLSLDVGEYKLSVLSRGRVVGPITVKVSCNGNRNPTFDLPLLGVDIDLKPGSFPNSINLNGNGVQAVAVFGALKFKVEDIDLNTVLFVVTGTDSSPVHRGHVKNVNGDGRPDIVFHFREFELGIPVGTPGNTTLDLFLTASLDDSTLFEGVDVARITPNNSKSRDKGGGPK
ncbi:MAG: hypothetical protein MK134_07245 [Dehalococcoidia bacterium]|nr:hypothetical protein [Dehalococcoidia bacterium]